jgi:hypothetical protein
LGLIVAILAACLLVPVQQNINAQTNGTPDAPSPAPHYLVDRPIPQKYEISPQRGFPYGWTRNGTSPIHHGEDYLNALGVPVIAAGAGKVYYAGPDTGTVFGPYPNFYGQVVVIEHNDKAPDGSTLFTLYGHLHDEAVQTGQNVGKGQLIGHVGKEGIAQWYHLHFEVRINNPRDYNAVRNPVLWYHPLYGTGTLMGRMVDSKGGLAMGVRFTIGTRNGVIPGWTYADPSIPSDPTYNENFVFGDLQAGCYAFRVRDNHGGYAYNKDFCIKAGELKFLDVKLMP